MKADNYYFIATDENTNEVFRLLNIAFAFTSQDTRGRHHLGLK